MAHTVKTQIMASPPGLEKVELRYSPAEMVYHAKMPDGREKHGITPQFLEEEWERQMGPTPQGALQSQKQKELEDFLSQQLKIQKHLAQAGLLKMKQHDLGWILDDYPPQDAVKNAMKKAPKITDFRSASTMELREWQDKIQRSLDGLETHFDALKQRVSELEKKLADSNVAELERKIDVLARALRQMELAKNVGF